ncbi:MAG: hypothetical protein ACOC9E_06180, partial [Chloroflexota bacterium]
MAAKQAQSGENARFPANSRNVHVKSSCLWSAGNDGSGPATGIPLLNCDDALVLREAAVSERAFHTAIVFVAMVAPGSV